MADLSDKFQVPATVEHPANRAVREVREELLALAKKYLICGDQTYERAKLPKNSASK